MPAITLNLLDSAGSPALTKVLSFKAFDGSVLSATAGTDSFSATLAPQTYRVLIDGVDSGVDYTPRFDSASATMPAHLGGGYYLMAHPRSISIDKRVTQPGSHTHQIGDVTGLQSALDGKSPTGHTHSSLVPENINEINVNTSMAGSTLWWGYRGATNAITKHAFSQGKANGALARLDVGDATESTNAVTKAQLDTKVDKVTGRQLMPDPNGDSRYVLNGAGNWFQALGSDGLLRADLMPPLAISETFTCSTQSAMLALTAQKGDICVRTDLGGTYILASEPATTLANWTQILTPADGVQSVNSKSGASITLDHGDLFNLNSDSTKLHVTQTEKDTWSGKADSAHAHSSLVPENINEINVNTSMAGSTLWWGYRGATNAITKHAFSQGRANGALARLDIADATESTNAVTKSQLDTKEPALTAGTTSQYYRGDKSWQTLDKSAVGLGNVNNTSDANKPISTATQTALDGKAPTGHAHSSLVPENTNEININTSMAGSTLYWGYRGATNAITKHVFGQGKANAALARIDIADATEPTNAVAKGQADSAYVAKGGSSPTTNFTQASGSALGFKGTVNTVQVQVNNGIKILKVDVTAASTGDFAQGAYGGGARIIGQITNWSTVGGGANVSGVLSYTGLSPSRSLVSDTRASLVNINVQTDGTIYIHAPNVTENSLAQDWMIPSGNYIATILLI